MSGGVTFATAGNILTVNNTFAIETGGATFNQTGSGHLTLSNQVSGDGLLTKAGGGSMTLSANSDSFGGGVAINNGTLNAAASIESLGYGSVTLNGGTLAITDAGAIKNDIAVNADATISDSDSVTLSGRISGTGALTKAGGGALTLAGDNSSFAGAINLDSGVIIASTSNALGTAAGGTTLANGTTLRLGNGVTIADALTLGGVGINAIYGALKVNEGSATVNGNISLAADTNIGAFNAGDLLTLNGVISGDHNLTKVGSGSLVLSGSSTYSGTTTVNAGTLRIATDANLGAGQVVLAEGTTLDLTGATTIDNTVALSGAATVSHAQAVTLSGVISGANGLSKSGAGTLTLSAVNTYSGTTDVASGTLAVTGSLAGGAWINSGAALTGTGTLGGAVILEQNSTLAAGNAGAGALTLGGLANAQGGAILAVDLHGTTAGSGYDQLVVNGTVDVSGSNLSLDLGSFTPSVGNSFTLIDNDSTDAIIGTIKVGGSSITEGGTFSQGDKIFQVSYIGGTGNDLVLSVINNAPVLNAAASPAFTAIAQDVADASNPGQTVAALVVDGSISDVDGTALEAIAVNAVDNTHGTWQYKVDAGAWTAFDFSGGNSGKTLLLASTDSIRFVPNAGWSGSANLTFHAWDQSGGSAGVYLTVGGATGGSGPLSAASDTAAITVIAPPSDPAPTIPDDGDNIPASTEQAVPSLPPATGATAVAGDGNGDGKADSQQANVTSAAFLKTATAQSAPGDAKPVYVTLVADSVAGKTDTAQANTTVLKAVAQLDAPANKPADVDMPLGQISFTADVVSAGAAKDFSLYVDDAVLINGYWKQDAAGTWVNLASSTYGGKVVSEGGKTRLDFTLVDGGAFDDDGVADGVITDPGAPGYRATAGGDADSDQFPDALEAAYGLTVGTKDNDVFQRTEFLVLQLYRDFLFREAEADGLTYWMQQIDAGLMTRSEVAVSFLDSVEFQAGVAPLARLYLGAFGRLPDEAGMNNWIAARLAGQSLHDIAAEFAGSAEFAGRFGGLDDTALVAQLYQAVLGRAPEATGTAYWEAQRAAGLSTGDLLLAFTESTEYAALSDRDVTVTLDYIGLLGRSPEQQGFDYWVDRLDAGMSEIAVIGAFIDTAEYHDRFLL
nr:DUF4214 domain-containing protein [Stutzerimonas kunmingensis]